MSKATFFEFVDYKLQDSQIILGYAIGLDGQKMRFSEKISLPMPVNPENIPQDLLQSTLQTLHFMCGLSYWKLYCPSEIRITSTSLTKHQADFWNTVYTKGLGEFFYRNQIIFNNLISFPYTEGEKKTTPFPRQERALMGVGGGKDSLVSYELLKEKVLPVTAYILETQKEYDLINEVIEKMGVEALRIKREIDIKLFEQNKIAGAYNGHIPITAIYSVIGLICAIFYDYKYIVMSNEKSANYGNVMYEGVEINHQWSKSEEFEKMFHDYIHRYITPDVEYYSILRPYSEMKIVEKFINHPEYFSVFSSCNNNFKVMEKGLQKGIKWCGECPKCAFVFCMLAAFLPKKEVVNIFKKDLYNDATLLPIYKELLGIKDIKPFECVGTPEEVSLAFYKAAQKGEYKNEPIMKMFESEVMKTMTDISALEKEVLR